MKRTLVILLLLCLSCTNTPHQSDVKKEQIGTWELFESFEKQLQSKNDLLKQLGEPKYKITDKKGDVIWIFSDKKDHQRWNFRLNPTTNALTQITYFPSANDEVEFSKEALKNRWSLRNCSEREEIKTIKDVTLIRNYFECKDGVKAVFDSNSVLSITISK